MRSTDKTRVIEEQVLSADQLRYLRSFNPGYFNDGEIPSSLDQLDAKLDKQEIPNDHFESFCATLKDLRQEYKEIQAEINEFEIGQNQNNMDV